MKVSLLQIPYDSGHYGKRMGQGPIHLLEQGLVEYLEEQGSDVEHTECGLSEDFVTEVGAAKELNNTISKLIYTACKKSRFPIVLAGNCNMAIGTMAGLKQFWPKVGVVWFDAHADFNTPDTSSSGFFDGMGLSILTGNSWKAWRETLTRFTPISEENVILIGARDFDAKERNLLDNSKINLIPVSKIRNNIDAALSQPLQILSQHCKQVYVHIDLDVFDPCELKANGFSVEDGLLPSEVKDVIKELCENFNMIAFSFNSYDPSHDPANHGYKIVTSILDTTLPIVQNHE